MKKGISILLLIVLSLLTLQGCKQEEANVNKTYDTKKMKTLVGQPFNADEAIGVFDAYKERNIKISKFFMWGLKKLLIEQKFD